MKLVEKMNKKNKCYVIYMNSRYILQSILINKDEDKLTDAIEWLLETDKILNIEQIEEDDKYYRLLQTELSKEYFPILLKTVNKELGIHYLFYSKSIFPTLVMSQARP